MCSWHAFIVELQLYYASEIKKVMILRLVNIWLAPKLWRRSIGQFVAEICRSSVLTRSVMSFSSLLGNGRKQADLVLNWALVALKSS